MSETSQFNTPFELESFLKQQQQNQHLLLERLIQLEAQASKNPHPSQSESSSPSRKKICLPEKFDGERKNFRSFISQIELLFLLHPSTYASDIDKVGLICSLLTGKAALWCTPIIESLDSSMLGNYPVFKARLAQAFDDPHRKASAFEDINKLRQASRDLITYTSEFQRLASELDWSQETLIQYYRRGLQDEIRRELIHFDTPNTLLEMISLASRMEARIKEYHMSSTRDNQRRRDNLPTFKPNTPLDENSSPMEVGGQRKPRLTDQEKQRRRQYNLCMYCGDADHQVLHCHRKAFRSADPKATGR